MVAHKLLPVLYFTFVFEQDFIYCVLFNFIWWKFLSVLLSMIKFKRLLQFLWHYWKHLLKFCLCISVIFNVAFLWYTKVTLLLHSILIVCMASLINGERTPFGIFIFKFLEYVIPGCYLKENVIEKKKIDVEG